MFPLFRHEFQHLRKNLNYCYFRLKHQAKAKTLFCCDTFIINNFARVEAGCCAPFLFWLEEIRLTHIDCSWESLTFCKNCESVVKTGHVVFSLNLICEKRFVACEGSHGVVFVHGKGSSAAVNLVKDSVDDAGSTSSESGEVFVLYLVSRAAYLL